MTFDEGLASPELLSQSTTASSDSPNRDEEHTNYQNLAEEEIKEDLHYMDKTLALSGSSTSAGDHNSHGS